MTSSDSPDFRLDGRKALITGAGRGLGEAIAKAFALAGAEVHLMARSKDELDQLVAEITAAGGVARAIPMDVTDRAACDAAIAENGPYHVLVNNAGSIRKAPAVEMSEADFDFVCNLNIRAAYFVAREVAKGMIAHQIKGSVINMSSQMGHVGGIGGRSVYCLSKFAMEGFSKCMALEWAEHGIRVNTLCPTFIETPLTKASLEEPEFGRYVLNQIALNRVGQPIDVAGAALFLASDASSLMTGSALMVDGGWTAV